MIHELDPLDLVRTLNSQADLPGWPRHERSAGGSASVSPSETIGVLGDCWCGRPDDHDWLGRAEGAPHPRYPD